MAQAGRRTVDASPTPHPRCVCRAVLACCSEGHDVSTPASSHFECRASRAAAACDPGGLARLFDGKIGARSNSACYFKARAPRVFSQWFRATWAGHSARRFAISIHPSPCALSLRTSAGGRTSWPSRSGRSRQSSSATSGRATSPLLVAYEQAGNLIGATRTLHARAHWSRVALRTANASAAA